MTPLTPEQIAEQVSVARRLVGPYPLMNLPQTFSFDPMEAARALLAEHERAERLAAAATREAIARTNAALNAQDAARWRAVRESFAVETDGEVRMWYMKWDGLDYRTLPLPATVDEAADRLIAEQEQEAHDG